MRRHAGDGGSSEVERLVPGHRRVGERLHQRDGARPLHRQQRQAIGGVVDIAQGADLLPEPGHVLVAVGGVDDDEDVVGTLAIDDGIVDDPADGRQAQEYIAWPSASLPTSLVTSLCTASTARGPRKMTSPMCETSKMPAASRTALCSSRMPEYWTGIAQPPKSITFAPRALCRPYRGVCFIFVGVRGGGIEPPWFYPLAPQASASTSSAILATAAFLYETAPRLSTLSRFSR